MTAWIVDGAGELLSPKTNAAFFERYSSARERGKLFGNKPSGVGGTLWEREAARDVQAHGEPRPLRVPTWRAAVYPAEARRVVRANIENRRLAMRVVGQ